MALACWKMTARACLLYYKRALIINVNFTPILPSTYPHFEFVTNAVKTKVAEARQAVKFTPDKKIDKPLKYRKTIQ
jgi:hypothetical protein